MYRNHTVKFAVVSCWALACLAIAGALPWAIAAAAPPTAPPWTRAPLSWTCAGRPQAQDHSLQAFLCALYTH
jgi:hypothetical protein